MNAITENVSINQPKRGRPYLFFTDANDKRECKKHYPDVRTDRTLVNRLYSDRALSVLGDGHKPEFLWLADAQTGRYRRTVLTELGRVNEDDLLLDVAFDLCERKLKTVAAVRLIRNWRGVLKPASLSEPELGDEVTHRLRMSVQRWRKANPSKTVLEFLGLCKPFLQTAADSGAGSTPQSPR
jgi:hypothetical protein